MKRTALAFLALLLPATALADPKDDARRHFGAGLEAAQRGEYEIALQRFLAAQNAYPHPATLYNIARAYADMEDLENALAYYRLYQDAAPDKAADVDPVIQVLEARLGQGQSVPTAPQPVAGTGGGRTIVVGGATEEELARLESIAAELQALTQALQTRTAEELAAAEATDGTDPDSPDGTDPDAPDGTDPDAPDGTDPDALPELPDAGFISDAYEKLVVTASRVGQDPLDSPSTLTVLTDEDIRLSGATNLPDILRRVVGVDMMSLSSAQQDMSIRGFNRELANKVLILVDGRSTYLDFLGATIWATVPVSLEEIDRIEVIRGPGSAVYGANAVTGVINIITKTPGEEPRTVFRGAGGTNGYGSGSVYTSQRVDRTSFRLSASYNQVGRWAKSARVLEGTDTDALALESPLVDNEDLALRVLRANGRVDRSVGTKGYVSLSGGLSRADNIEYFNIGALGDYVIDDHAHHYVRADAGYDVVHFRAFWNHDDAITGPYVRQKGARDLDAKYRLDTVDLELEAPLSFDTGPLSHVLNVGIGYRRLDTRFGYLAGGFDQPYAQNHFRGFLNEELTWKDLKVVGSLRVDKHPLLDVQETISPRAALIYRLFDKTSVRATAGRAFRQPNNIESYMDFNLPSTADGAYIRDFGSQGLSPEQITTFEVGVHDESTYFHAADVVFYYNRVTNLIFLDSVTPSIEPFDPRTNGYQAGTTGWINQGDVYTGYGVEAEIETYPTDGLDIFANVAVSTVLETPPDGEAVRDGSSSLVKMNLGAAYRTPYRIDISAQAHFVSAQTWRLREFDAGGNLVLNEAPIPARTILNARLAGRPLADDSLELAIGVWNAIPLAGFDNRFQEHPKGHPVGAIAYGEVSYAF
ncbi:MAG: TonB-dependent receptor [Alphaproteobacteria bacterium]|nr:TonB-dependent receptor [Alphaproteobacteria bacterium]